MSTSSPPVLHLGEHLQPEPRTLLTITGPDTKDVAFSVHGDAHHDIERGVSHLPVTDLHDDRVDEDHRVKRIQRPARPFGEFPADLLGDLADRVLEDLRPIDLVEMRDDLTRSQPPARSTTARPDRPRPPDTSSSGRSPVRTSRHGLRAPRSRRARSR